ncbi:MAG TPA: alpha-hydroxy acid oxidase [Acidimicrobiales bacterium]|nr:alpha-hydroxy acid oxidase [Acidimicrobiales bacterium]
MRLSEIKEMVQLRPIEWDATTRRLNACLSIEDLRRLAQRRLPAVVFDYIDGGAEDEVTVTDNRTAFRQWQFLPRVLEDVTTVDLRTPFFGGQLYDAPLALCPTGYTRMTHPGGEVATAAAAQKHNVPYALSTVGTTSIEDLSAGRHGDLWFQLYVLRDRGLARSLVERAQASGYGLLEITIDTPVTGLRRRDVRNGLTVPPRLRPSAVAEIATHVSYWTNMLRSPALAFANLGKPEVGEEQVSPSNMANIFDPSVTWDDIAEVRSWWRGPLLLKGPFGPQEARRALSLGVEGFHLSNHGGRQLDRCVPALDLVLPVREAVGDEPAIILDSGIRQGADIALAIALGANMCAIGRPYLYGLAAGGEQGVARALDLLKEELKRAMQLLGVTSLAELRDRGPALVRRKP